LEAEALCGLPVTDLESARTAAQALAARFPCVVVTAGGDGAALAQPGVDIALSAEKVKLISTHGAGDCFIGTFIAQLALGLSSEIALAKANAAAARHVSTLKL
jgi:ribokinase